MVAETRLAPNCTDDRKVFRLVNGAMSKKKKLTFLEKAVKRLQAEDAKNLTENMRKAMEDFKKDESDKMFLEGKYDPRNIVKGKCAYCQGDVVEKVVLKVRGEIRLGGKSSHYHSHDGFYCKQCGLKFEFIREEYTEVDDAEVEIT